MTDNSGFDPDDYPEYIDPESIRGPGQMQFDDETLDMLCDESREVIWQYGGLRRLGRIILPIEYQ